MKVTRFNYPIETNLITKFNLMVNRVSGKGAKKDVVLIFEGGEGEGKTTFAVAAAYYFAEKTGREFDETHVYFDLEELMKVAINTEKQILIWDEPALQALSTDWASAIVKNLTRLLMMARKKQHILIINMTKFYKFNEYIVVDRAIGLIHVYSRKNIQPGHFQYIRKKNLESLWRDYRFAKKRNYKKYASKYVRGTFADILNKNYKNNVLSEFDINSYERKKDAAIQMIGKVEKVDKKQEIRMKTTEQLRKKNPKITQKELAEIHSCSLRTIQRDDETLSHRTYEKPPSINSMGIQRYTEPKTNGEIEKKNK